MKFNVVIIGINYYPEDSAIGLYTTQMAEYLVEKNHEVSVITGFPYYPQWKIAANYKDRPLFFKERINGVNIIRCKQYVPANPTFLKRILHILTFSFGNFINLFRVNRPDIIISIIPFTTSALLGVLLKFRYKTKLWIHIQDFEFDAALDSGVLKPNRIRLLTPLMWIEKLIFDKAEMVSSISYGMIQKLKTKTKTKTFYLPNWIDVDQFEMGIIDKKHPYLTSLNFKILYSGNIGAKQDWDFFFSFISALKKFNGVEVVIVGDGALRKYVVDFIKKYDFVTYYPPVPYSDLPHLLYSADMHILFQKNNVIDTVMPSKLLGMMASEKPSIVTGNIESEVAKIFSENEIGFYFANGSIDAIVDKTLLLKTNVELRQAMGRKAKEYIIKNFNKNEVLSNFLTKLSDIH